MKPKNITTISTLIALLLLPSMVSAQVGISPIDDANKKVTYIINPGETIEDKANIRNFVDKNLTLKIYGADGTQTDRGAFTLTQPYETQNNLGVWMDIKEKSLELNSKEQKNIDYSITIPSGATPGTYGGGIAVVTVPNQNPNNKVNGAGVVTSTRMILPIYVTIPGEVITKYNWENYTHSEKEGNHFFNFKIKNEGNTTVMADGTIEITGWPFFSKKEISMSKITLFGKDEVDVQIPWNEKPILGFLSATATLEFSEINAQTGDVKILETLTKTDNFNIIPWGVIILILIIVGLLISVKIYFDSKFKKILKTSEKYIVKEDETLQSIAESKKTSWKLLAKINNLKPPYSLKKGNEILIPTKK